MVRRTGAFRTFLSQWDVWLPCLLLASVTSSSFRGTFVASSRSCCWERFRRFQVVDEKLLQLRRWISRPLEVSKDRAHPKQAQRVINMKRKRIYTRINK